MLFKKWFDSISHHNPVPPAVAEENGRLIIKRLRELLDQPEAKQDRTSSPPAGEPDESSRKRMTRSARTGT